MLVSAGWQRANTIDVRIPRGIRHAGDPARPGSQPSGNANASQAICLKAGAFLAAGFLLCLRTLPARCEDADRRLAPSFCSGFGAPPCLSSYHARWALLDELSGTVVLCRAGSAGTLF